MIICVVRHGQTDFNKEHRLQGRAIDEPLNADGEREVYALLDSLPTDFEIIFASSLKRVKKSADIIAEKFGKQVIVRDEISERDFGNLAGKTWDEIPGGRDLQDQDRKFIYDYRPYGGESVDDVIDRINIFIEFLKTTEYKNVLVVSSIGVIRLFYKILLNQQVVEIKNASVHKFKI